MTSPVRAQDLILCLTPFGEPDAGPAVAACGAGALGILDLGDGDRRSREELNRLSRAAPGPFGVRVTGRCALDPGELGDAPDTVVLAQDAPWNVGEVAARYRWLAEVTDLAQAREAVRAGAHGLIARGTESGGRVGGLSTFVLLQLLLADDGLEVPVWACGGIGPRTAAAAVAGGAAGVVLDSQLALLAESRLPEAVRAALRSLDGSETVVVAGHRVLRRRGPDAPPPPPDDAEAVAALLGARDLRRQLLPVGQDGFLAARFAERWGDVRRTVREVRAAIREVVGAEAEGAEAEGAEAEGTDDGGPRRVGAPPGKPVGGEPVKSVGSGLDEPVGAGEVAPADGESVGVLDGGSAVVGDGLTQPFGGGSTLPGGGPAELFGGGLGECAERGSAVAGGGSTLPGGGPAELFGGGLGECAERGSVAAGGGSTLPGGGTVAAGGGATESAGGGSTVPGRGTAVADGGSIEAFVGRPPESPDAESPQSVDHDPASALRPGSPMSRALGTRLPVAQGPMTRVSDQAGFAAAVAADGALPFLALALADGERTRAMLTEARAVLDGRSWGVGVLGFAPEDIRNAQLEAVRELRPTHAIIAGGRPAQAEALERVGIRTYLHVPSPGLLRQFLQAGARRFVFEGSECGGHVGPRASFPLWEAQLAVLEDFLDDEADAGTARQLEVFFAGGIHDERSAAMTAALAAPLTARGAAVGVLMGTAYLFTEEAVAHGAIQRLFQRQVLTATATALLETAPGHATRCVPSPFTTDYRAREAGLRASGLPDREVWEALERLNVGRLRIASKGVERSAEGELTGVDEERQLSDGMFMAGEVAVLRSATTSLAQLHHAVTDGAADLLAARAPRPAGPRACEPAPPAPLDVAVVGMACMFPQAPDLATFWANVVAGRDAVTEVPADRWDPAVHHEAGSTASKWGGFLPRIPFDPLGYGIPPASLGSIEPVQLLSLEAARRALDDAGYGDRGRTFDRSRTSVVFGAEAGSDLSNAATLRAVLPSYYGKVPDGLEEQLPRLTEDSFPGMLANVISGRIANRLDLGGANYTVDAACASSLAALDVACKELVSGGSDVVLCGGADLHNGINDFVLFSSVHALSPTGRSRAFDGSADGIALGEGVACVVLKRLADAERDGDRVYGVIKGLGSASDGRSLGLTAPRPEGQRAALLRAYRNAGVSPAEVGLVEAHGTGTVVGDRTELTVLGEVFAEAGAETGTCALGSVKSQIGHTKCAAGLAGLIKTTLALYTGVKPPTLHLDRPNPAWSEEESPFAFHTGARPWAAPAAERLAGVSAFGFGGTNFHAVLGAYDGAAPPQQTLDTWPAELFLFRGKDTAAAHRDVEEILRAAESDGRPWRLRDLALAAARRADTSHEPVRAAVVARDVDDLIGQLRRILAGEHDPAADSPVEGEAKVAFLFPGQGSQRPGMLADLLVALPELRHYLHLGRAHADALYPPAAFDEAARERRRADLTDTRAAQPALGITGLAAHAFLTAAGVQPDLAAGHSYGELVALSAAGALDPETLLELSTERASAILAAAGDEPGTMAAVGAGAEDVARALRAAGAPESVVVANHNSPDQSVISGPTVEVEAAVGRLREAGLGVRRIPVACAFHSPVVAAAGERFAKVLADKAVRAPEFPVWANRTASPYPQDADAVRVELAAQIGAPVAFAAQIEAMYEAGARIFVEAGPGTVLTRLVGRILGDRPHRTVACEPRADSGLPGWLDALAQLALAGLPVRTAWLLRGRDAVDALRTPVPRRPGWTVDGHLVRTADGALLPGALAPARRVVETTVTTNPQYGVPAGQDALISEFLRTSREMIAAQRDVLLTYFGAAPGATPQAPDAPAPIPQAVLPEPARLPAAATPLPEPTEPEPEPERDVEHVVLEIISERTGYPVDMIEPDLDLEADLSIDSIKRAEIAGELARRLGIAGGAEILDDAELEELAKARTAASVTAWLTARVGGGAGAVPEPTAAADQRPAAPHEHTPLGEAPKRCELRPVPLPHPSAAPAATLPGTRFVLLGDGGGAAAEVAARLREHGADTVTVDQAHLLGEADGRVDGVLYLGALPGPELPVLPEAFPVLQAALARAPRSLLAVQPADGEAAARSAGLHGLFRTVAREYPDTLARIVTVPDAAPAAVADALLAELLAPEPAPVVLRTDTGQRHGLELVPAPLGPLGSTGAGPAGDGAAEAAALGLDRDSVVLLVGGARGITARFAVALAAASRCRIELVGRTPAPTAPETPAIAAARTAVELRAALAASGSLRPAEVNRAAELVLAQREITATLAELAALGSEARYRSVDFRERDAALQAVKEIHAEHGRLDGVVFAAGVIEDRLIAEKSPDSFRRVYGTKTTGAAALLSALDDLPDGPGFTVLFGSIAAVLGNRGQADYAAANDALERLGADWAERTGHRALTVHWGPWAPSGIHSGMVGEELGREYARRGVQLIDPDEGTAALLRELAWGDRPARAVVYTASGW
ncbi:SDR family NAD(P)-dependent oxidoreductase [Streptomyces sp. NPDC093060]|uniref:SDR family NAD(P)-dependent oxidoreductase n=1 Tax=Streptomyces sp. NPDC093060 TaxID=3366019 RepID=UPI0037FE49A2